MKFEQALSNGSRVRVHRDPDYGPGPWPSEPLGTVGSYELVSTRQGPERTYWITFDEPQFDADGDGPYVSSQVEESYLEPAPE
jgi:hypothetical protein